MSDQNKMKVFAICGSTRKCSVNLQILHAICKLSSNQFEIEIYTGLAELPHFNPDLDKENDCVPDVVQLVRNKIAEADGVLICTPEYVFSLPGSLKNLIEWTVSTTAFSEKPVALITASGLGQKAHEALQLIMKTIYADVQDESQLLISGVRSKINYEGEITDEATLQQVKELIFCFTAQMMKSKKNV
jgi:chromate reductase, NAD(P)H dehydrogenase (quinone)